MMTDEDKAMIASLVDGALEGEPREQEIRDLVERDPEAMAYAMQVGRSNRLIREAFEAPMREPMPAGIRAALFAPPGKVSILHQPRVLIPTAVAASLVLALGIGAGIGFLAPEPEAQIAVLGDVLSDGPLHQALETLPSGRVSEAGVQPMLTFLDGTGRACREFEVIGELPDELEFGIACRQPAGTWHVEVVVAAPIADATPVGEGFAPASGGAADRTLETMLDALGAGPALDAAEEAALLGSGWRTH
ncbi:MAG: hypothetical protein AAFR79_15680 [Pseudomonadota bacterium]